MSACIMFLATYLYLFPPALYCICSLVSDALQTVRCFSNILFSACVLLEHMCLSCLPSCPGTLMPVFDVTLMLATPFYRRTFINS
jgi:hypothetical protein